MKMYRKIAVTCYLLALFGCGGGGGGGDEVITDTCVWDSSTWGNKCTWGP